MLMYKCRTKSNTKCETAETKMSSVMASASFTGFKKSEDVAGDFPFDDFG